MVKLELRKRSVIMSTLDTGLSLIKHIWNALLWHDLCSWSTSLLHTHLVEPLECVDISSIVVGLVKIEPGVWDVWWRRLSLVHHQGGPAPVPSQYSRPLVPVLQPCVRHALAASFLDSFSCSWPCLLPPTPDSCVFSFGTVDPIGDQSQDHTLPHPLKVKGYSPSWLDDRKSPGMTQQNITLKVKSKPWTGLDWSGLVWTGLVWSGPVWTGLDWTGLDLTGLDWTGLD